MSRGNLASRVPRGPHGARAAAGGPRTVPRRSLPGAVSPRRSGARGRTPSQPDAAAQPDASPASERTLIE